MSLSLSYRENRNTPAVISFSVFLAVTAGLVSVQPEAAGQQLVSVARIQDDSDGFTELYKPRGVTTFQTGSNTYAIIAAELDNGIQIVDVTDPTNPIAAAHVRDSDTRRLDGARDIDLFETSGRTYAIVASSGDNGVQVIDVTDPHDPVAAGYMGDDNASKLRHPLNVAVFKNGGGTYAIVTAAGDDAIQIIDISDPFNLALAGQVVDNDSLELDKPFGVDIFEIGDKTYAIVVGHTDHGVQIIDITDPDGPAAAGRVADNDVLELHAATDVAVFEAGGNTYAFVTGYEDHGIQIINVTDPFNPAPAGRITETDGGWGYKTSVQVDIFEVGGSAYAAVSSYNSNSIHLIDLTDPSGPFLMTSLKPSGLRGTFGVDVFETGGSAYAITTGGLSDDAHIVRISMTVDRPPWVVPNPQLSTSVPVDSTYEDAGATCTDETDGDLTGQIQVTSNVNTSIPGDYTVTYSCADSAGNTATATRAVTVVGDAAPTTIPAGAPVITMIGSAQAEVSVDGDYADAGATCTDEADGDLTGVMVTASDVNIYAHGNYTVTYSCTDSTGNTATATRAVTVTDSDAPQITLTGAATVRIVAGGHYDDTGATCKDRVEGDLTDEIVATGNIDTDAPGEYAVTYSCADTIGNEATSARTVTVLDAISIITDGAGGFNQLDGAIGVAVFENGEDTYAIVAANKDDGVQIINVTDPARPVAVADIDDAGLPLEGLRNVAIFKDGDDTYAAVTAYYGGMLIINVTDPARPALAASISDDDNLILDGASHVAVFEDGDDTYAIVTAFRDNGIQIVNVTDPLNPVASGQISDSSKLKLDGAHGVAVFEDGDDTYAIVTASRDNGIQIIKVTDPANPAAEGSISDNRRHNLEGASHVAVFKDGDDTYAIVTASRDNGIQIIKVTNPAKPIAKGRITYNRTSLKGFAGVAVFEEGDSTNAIVAQYMEDGIQIINITDPSRLVTKKIIRDDLVFELDGAYGVATFKDGEDTYAIITALDDDGAQIIPLVVSSSAANTATVPGAPTSLGVSLGGGSGALDVSWQAPASDGGSNLTGYTVQWKLASGSWDVSSEVSEAATTETAHAITGLTDGTSYAVRILATNEIGDSAPSSEVTATPQAPVSATIPGAPTSLGVSLGGGSGALDFSWQAPASDGGSSLTGYTVQWKLASGSWDVSSEVSEAAATGTTHAITGLTDGTPYAVRILATNEIGDSAPSAEVTATPQAPVSATIPGAPTSLGVSLGGGSGALDVSWQAPASDGGSSLTGYTVQWKLASGSWDVSSEVSEAAATGTTHAITGLTDGTPYAVRILATNEIGDSAPSAEVTATPQASAPSSRGPYDIGRISLTSTQPGVVEASWEASSETPANYRISWAKVGEPYLTWKDAAGNAFPVTPSWTITGLEEGAGYKVKVRASYNGTAGAWSGELTITTARSTNTNTIPGAPTSLGVSLGGGSGALDVSWQAPASDGGSNLTGYTVQWKLASGSWDVSSEVSEAATTETAHAITGLTDGTPYAVRILATNEIGDSAPSSEVTATPQAPVSATIPGAPTSLGVSLGGGSGALDFSWQTPASDGGSSLTGYTVQWKLASGSWDVSSEVSEAAATGTTHAITGLTDGTPYAVRILATNEIGDSAPSAEVTATPQASAPSSRGPYDIGRISLTSTQPGIVEASWEASSETPANYRISWAKVGEAYLTWKDAAGNAFPVTPSWTITGLEEGAGYKVKVRASYNGTAGAWSGELTITTARSTNTNTIPGAPTSLGVSLGGGSGALDVSWQAPASDGGSNLTGYTVQWKLASGSWDVSSEVSEAAATGTAHAITGLTDGTPYAVRILATNEIGDSAPSSEVTATPQAPVSATIPGAPTSLGVSLGGGSGALDFSWQTPASDGGSSLTGYTVQWKLASGSWDVSSEVSEAAATGTTHAITGLTDGTPYAVRILATNEIGDSAPSAEVTATPQASAPSSRGPHDIGRISLTSTQPGIVEASWEASSETPANYRISWAKVGEAYLTWKDAAGNAFPVTPSWTITGLEEGAGYKVKVRASYNGTAGAWSSEVTVAAARP